MTQTYIRMCILKIIFGNYTRCQQIDVLKYGRKDIHFKTQPVAKMQLHGLQRGIEPRPWICRPTLNQLSYTSRCH